MFSTRDLLQSRNRVYIILTTISLLLSPRTCFSQVTQAITHRTINYEELPDDRLSYIEELERGWWYRYKVQYFTSLVPTQRWLRTERNMCPGDVVLIEYKNKSFPGTYRLGRVNEVEHDTNDGLVRTCTVSYKLIKPGNARDINKNITAKEVRVPVQRLVLIMPIEEQ